MRGFSNRAIRPREHDEAITHIAKRFAPRIVTSTLAPAPADREGELAMLLNLAGKSFGQGFRCLWGIKRVLATRTKLRMKIAYHRVMQSRYCAWALAGWGWSFSFGLGLLLVVK